MFTAGELERYAAGGIENTEGFFWASSELVLHYLRQQKRKVNTSTHTFALCSSLSIIRAFIPDPDEQLKFTLLSFQQFLPEFADRSFKVDLDKKCRELSPGIVMLLIRVTGLSRLAYRKGLDVSGK
jgi:hypothetical protein